MGRADIATKCHIVWFNAPRCQESPSSRCVGHDFDVSHLLCDPGRSSFDVYFHVWPKNEDQLVVVYHLGSKVK